MLRAVFSCFHSQKFVLHFRVRTKKLLDAKVIFFHEWEIFLGSKKMVLVSLSAMHHDDGKFHFMR